jgi:hypothetical protein
VQLRRTTIRLALAIALAFFASVAANAQVATGKPPVQLPKAPAVQPPARWQTKIIRTAPLQLTGTGAPAGWQTKAMRAAPLQLTGTGAPAGWQTKAIRTTPVQLTGTGAPAGWQTKTIRTTLLQLTGTGKP